MLKRRYPEECRSLESILRRALVAAEDSGGYDFLPPGYYLDRSDPDVLVLRREDGSVVASFSTQGVTQQGIMVAVREDLEGREQEG